MKQSLGIVFICLAMFMPNVGHAADSGTPTPSETPDTQKNQEACCLLIWFHVEAADQALDELQSLTSHLGLNLRHEVSTREILLRGYNAEDGTALAWFRKSGSVVSEEHFPAADVTHLVIRSHMIYISGAKINLAKAQKEANALAEKYLTDNGIPATEYFEVRRLD